MFGLSAFCGAPFCTTDSFGEIIESLQTISFTQTGVAVPNYLITQSLLFVEDLIGGSINNITLSDIISLVQDHQLNTNFLLQIIQTLTLIESNVVFVLPGSLGAVQSLTLAQSIVVNNIYNTLNEQVISLIHNTVLNFIYNLEVCSCLILDQKAGQWIALSVTQALIFVLTEVLGVEQTIEFLETLDTNFDSSCCGDIYGIADRELANEMVINQTVQVGGVYSQNVAQSVSLLSTGLWRT